MYFAIFAIALIYIAMKFYFYHLLITFDLTIPKILKNSLIFSVLGIKRNLMAFLGLIFLFALHFFLIILMFPMGISIPFVLPLLYVIAVIGFIGTYAAYPIIDRYMIAPYESEQVEDEIASDEE